MIYNIKKLNYVFLGINISILVLFISLSIIFVVYKAFSSDSFLYIGKDLYIDVQYNQVINWTCINVNSEDNLFVLLDTDTKNKLIAFMKNNNLEIKPGSYELNQTDDFQKVIIKLRFKTIE